MKRFLYSKVFFSIGSFMTFRLSEYDRRLKNYVEVSIEEYKMEQEYQNFIQSLRDYVMAREPRLEKSTCCASGPPGDLGISLRF
ncbi:hypothetical protein BsIDN1_50660 [Bacillus safensis]|uniref:Uncharacterized protein n=1 Tax=Bacillus safensis TaxID=561879 RepID=A0A5S9MEL5_BACIA|nr:hypothetical protein BsIDN1_50660 [Bacillus safensis]